ncbi:DUF2141 domain-containing protein [Duganella sp. CY15W]|uniref:DUF2141 domain-containing protein n=1 Tax=Duganella sp. CY15W TaxID=2692172 RepID=UPI00136EE1DC|nr:DUF2141 domain-containing protein [Duganella sp. CY15W]MYM27420.1 DUF2141 domain-containing protein [Duganella sp. CY15W]
MHLTLIGWLHTLACCYSLIIGAKLLWAAKGGTAHQRDGRRYIYAMVFVNLSALGIYQIGGFNIFHVLALCTLASLGIAFASARWQTPGRQWLRVHLTAIVFSYYQLIGGLINELFSRVPSLIGQQAMLGLSQGLTIVVFLMILAYFWGRTARGAAAAIALAALATTAQASTLTLDLKGVIPGKGSVAIVLYDSSESFLHKGMKKKIVPAGEAAMQVKLEDLAPGDYAVALFQDVNGNGKLDTMIFGIPSEPTGFSNDAEGSFGPPKYEAARFSLPADGRTIGITLHK